MPAAPPPPPTKLTLNGIDAMIYWDGYEKGESLQHGPWRDILYLVDWQLSDNFIDSLMGLIRPVGGKTGTWFRQLPHRYTGNTVIYCVEARGTPLGVAMPDEKLYASDLCLVRAHYEVPTADMFGDQGQIAPGGGDFGADSIPGSEWEVIGEPTEHPLKSLSLVFEGDNKPPGEDFPLHVIDETMRLTVNQVPAMYLDDIRLMSGSLNDTTFRGWGRGQVLFDRYHYVRTVSPGGEPTVRLTMEFPARKVDWNMLPKKVIAGPVAAGNWDFVKGVGGGARPYAYAELNNLLAFFNVAVG